MRILTIRTDKPEAELGIHEDQKQLAYIKWEAHRALSDTIFYKLRDLLNESSKRLEDIEGVVCFRGPGSFTGLRIGLSVANALAFARNIPITGTGGETWIEDGIKKLREGSNDKITLPEYGAPARTTKQRK